MVKVVEKILDWRLRGKSVEFYVKWKGQPDAENTWEPESSLDCKDLIERFKESRRAQKDGGFHVGPPGQEHRGLIVIILSFVPPGDNAKREETDDEKPWATGFDRGLEAEKIIGEMIIGGRYFLIIKLKDEEQAEVVFSTVARRKIPQMY